MYRFSGIFRHSKAFTPARFGALLIGVLLIVGCDPPPHTLPRELIPSFDGITVLPQSYFQDATIPNPVLPTALGGDAPLRYTLDPALPPGLTFDAATRVISGTPTETLEPTEFTYTAIDADSDTATLKFTMSVGTISLDADATELAEWNDPGVAVTVTVSEPPLLAVEVTLAASGTATPGGDYEFDGSPGSDSGEDNADVQVTIEAGAVNATTTLESVPDFDEEGSESIDLSVASANGSRFSASPPSVSLELLDEGAMFADAKDRLTSATLVFFNNFRQTGTDYEFHFSVINFGAETTSPTTMTARIDWEDFAPGQLLGRPLVSRRFRIPELPPGGGVRGTINLPNWIQIRYGPGIYTATATVYAPRGDYFSRVGGFRDRHSLLIPEAGGNPFTCQEIARPASPGAEDPLRSHQWNLHNTGQAAFAVAGGVPGEDLGMTGTLANGPAGRGIEVAVVDTGLEICHPDLRDSVAPEASYNFNAEAWPRSVPTDPFNPSAGGDHGTSVAGLIAATANNGIGIRGVAPGARLRGYNFLSAFDRGSDSTILLDALGASESQPDSAEVHIFNMSYGFLHGQQGNASRLLVDALAHGVTELRGGRGALYVKAAGNGFRICFGLRRQHTFANREDPYRPNDALGCSSANSDYNNNLPQTIVVGGFNAHGKRASYSGAGANLWVTAPAGESNDLEPALVTTDQAGPHRGADNRPGVVDPEGNAVDPDGDYRATFAGTSAAVPNTSGAVALLLETQPALTWRDVKHILARTARKIDPDVEPVRIAFGGKPAVLRHGWITNAAGYNFHNWYGFGAVSVDAAVELARTLTPDNLGDLTTVEFTHEGSVAIPDNDGGGAAQTLTVSGVSEAANIEAVELILRATHDFPNDLGVTLVSPAGTESIVNPIYNDALTSDPGGFRDWSLLTNAFYGESPNGDWSLRVIDAAPGDIGSLDAWTLKFSLGEHPE
ncbi:MAG: S8 family serine peptidase [Rhodospirillaceae bacterium]|nr:S8 family serine peptidase [Rhodospirillaceae bacterium]